MKPGEIVFSSSKSDSLASEDLDRDGFALICEVCSAEQIVELRSACDGGCPDGNSLTRGGARFGIRNLMSAVPRVGEFAHSDALLKIALNALGGDAKPVKATYFVKADGANWMVPWHQDITIAVRERIDTPGFGPWSEKAGVPHVQPPREILEKMLALRLHLDDAGEENGALVVIPGSHLDGKLSGSEIDERRKRGPVVVCSSKVGDVLLVRPLILHASMPAAKPSHRRVIHIEYAAGNLPNGLEWAQ